MERRQKELRKYRNIHISKRKNYAFRTGINRNSSKGIKHNKLRIKPWHATNVRREGFSCVSWVKEVRN